MDLESLMRLSMQRSHQLSMEARAEAGGGGREGALILISVLLF